MHRVGVYKLNVITESRLNVACSGSEAADATILRLGELITGAGASMHCFNVAS